MIDYQLSYVSSQNQENIIKDWRKSYINYFVNISCNSNHSMILYNALLLKAVLVASISPIPYLITVVVMLVPAMRADNFLCWVRVMGYGGRIRQVPCTLFLTYKVMLFLTKTQSQQQRCVQKATPSCRISCCKDMHSITCIFNIVIFITS